MGIGLDLQAQTQSQRPKWSVSSDGTWNYSDNSGTIYAALTADAEKVEANLFNLIDPSIAKLVVWGSLEHAKQIVENLFDINSQRKICTGYRPEWFPKKSIVEIAEIVHEVLSGASHGVPMIEFLQYLVSIQHVLDNWKEPTSNYDGIVKKLLQNVSEEVRSKLGVNP